MKLKLGLALATCLFAYSSLPAQALTIDFNAATPDGPLIGNTLVTSNATITSTSGLYNIADFGSNGSICPFIATRFNCQADLQIDFSSVINSLKFEAFGYDRGDNVLIIAFNGSSTVGSITNIVNQVVDLSSFGSITKVTFSNLGNGAGYAYGNFSFNQASVSTIPVPAALPLLLTGLIGAGVVAKRRGKKSA